MKFIIKQVRTCPEGVVTGTHYHICESEAEIEYFQKLNRPKSYIEFSFVGIVEEFNKNDNEFF